MIVRRSAAGRSAGLTAGVVGTIAVHAAAVAFLVVQVRPPRPSPPVYAVELVAAPLPQPRSRPAPEVVERPTPTPPAPVKSTPPKAVPVPTRRSPATTPREPAPRAKATEPPAPSAAPSTGSDPVTIKTPGLSFPYPEYLRNVVAQVYRRWDAPGRTALRAEVFFLILRDGSVRDIRFVNRSGSFTFDLNAQGAIEAAGNARAFGPLPDGFANDVLPISFYFAPDATP